VIDRDYKPPMTSTDSNTEHTNATDRFVNALALIPELSKVETIIRDSFRSDVTPMRTIPEYLLSLGGKRIRPALTLLCAKALGQTAASQELLYAAAGIELIHMATLMHDDIIDKSPVRRHKQSPYAKYGTDLTLLSGDFLLTRAFGLCAKLDDEIIEATEQACIELVEGEALETPLHIDSHSRTSSITIARRKTASLFRLSAFCAAHLSEVSTASVKAMCEFGESLGIAFQMIDDILDVTASEATLGKEPGIDLLERKPSIVNILWLESNDPRAQRLLKAPCQESERDFVRETLSFLPASPVIEQAKTLARDLGAQASKALETAISNAPHASSTAVAALHSVIDFALERLR
jgi:octaprenyl-diphosphate synthase